MSGTTAQPAPVSTPQSRDVLPRAIARTHNPRGPLARDLLRLLMVHAGVTDVASALEARAAVGLRKYGVPLRTFNGRDAREDMAQELLDAFMYAVQLEMDTDARRDEYATP